MIYKKSSPERGTSSFGNIMVHIKRKVLFNGSLLNYMKNVRFSSSLKVQDKARPQPELENSFKYADISVRLAPPNLLQPKPDVRDLVFGKFFTDHMFKVFFHEDLGGWQTPEITPLENLVLHPACKALHYAVQVFEGMKAYRGKDDKIRLFRPELNVERMNLSAQRLGLPTFNRTEFIKCLTRLISIDQEWVPHCETASLYIRPTLIGVDPTLGVATSRSALFYAILCPVGSYFHKKVTKGVSLLADPSFTRAWPGGCGDRKMGSNYAPTIHVQEKAEEKGLQQVLWLYGEDMQLTEAGTMNIFMFIINDEGEKELITPPLNGLILPGITRRSILNLALEWNQFKVTEKNITMEQVCRLNSEKRILEMFGAGTACVVSPISKISFLDQNIYIPTLDQLNPIHPMFLKALLDIQYGYIPDHPWVLKID
ncbi:branched-chain-amino-acid aminotransferase, cytosolic isoform X1 [Microplitis demolitor]|uniref:branched-chain-amino-acid aminotransferase, cytosolic isoform X1 n=2 Tax=Microplitis demolitor TaxID=69319 RepID=UPI00235B6FA6|nr:branched-chain-amino-acid aminotransferase, cytosolic isoform X1 [Microplitis demolitor]